MTAQRCTHPDYRHGLLVHDTDEQLVEETRAFVAQGLGSGGRVMVHGSRDRVGLMRRALGSPPGLEYGFDEELYVEPSGTLFAYQRRLEENPADTEWWVTGTVPLGRDVATQAAWHRYESALDVALARYPFRALCTYDTRTRPASVIATARATHPTVNVDRKSRTSPEYLDPAAFLTNPLAQVPAPPALRPCTIVMVEDVNDLRRARHRLAAWARGASAVSSQTIEQLLLAVHEVAANALVHGRPPVHVTLWADVQRLTGLVVDSGPGNVDPTTGFTYPADGERGGLWVARQMVDELFIGDTPAGGCSVLLIAS